MSTQIQSNDLEDFIDAGSVRLCCRVDGAASDPTILLIAGLGQQLISWPPAIVERLVERGFQVVRFDNRDVGRSSQSDAPPPKQSQLATRRFSPDQYSIDDMAADTHALIAQLGVAPVHAVGVSMGGMIAQNLAAQHPNDVASLTSIMSMTGALSGAPAISTLRLLSGKPARDEEEYIASIQTMFRHIGSRGFEFDADQLRELAIGNWTRGPGQQGYKGVSRQLAAILKSGNRTKLLAQVDTPTLVVHGDHDLMVNPKGGKATAKAIKGARFESIPGMGHDLPAALNERIVELIASHAEAAEATSTSASLNSRT